MKGGESIWKGGGENSDGEEMERGRGGPGGSVWVGRIDINYHIYLTVY